MTDKVDEAIAFAKATVRRARFSRLDPQVASVALISAGLQLCYEIDPQKAIELTRRVLSDVAALLQEQAIEQRI